MENQSNPTYGVYAMSVRATRKCRTLHTLYFNRFIIVSISDWISVYPVAANAYVYGGRTARIVRSRGKKKMKKNPYKITVGENRPGTFAADRFLSQSNKLHAKDAAKNFCIRSE